MANEEKSNIRPPRRGPMHGPGGMGAPGEKAKDFKGAVKRLFKELNKFKILMAISLLLAAISAVITILAPDKLTELTDTISEGLVVKKDNLQELVTKTTENFNEMKLKEIMPELLNINMNDEAIMQIMTDSNITFEDKQEFQNVMVNISKMTDENQIFNELLILPNNVLSIILPDSIY